MLEVKNLKKYYSKIKAVDGVSFNVKPGNCFGLLGPNGAGKTTTIEVIEGILEATSGEVLYYGQKLGEKFKEEVGIMFQSTALQDFITVEEILLMFGKLYKKNIGLAKIIEKCHLEEFLQQNNKQLSGGQKQRLLLGIALINDPMILFLDEPTTGLDPQARRNLWDIVNEIKRAGKTVILTTHYMDEAYELSDEIAIMDKGKIIAQGTPNELLTQHFDETIIEIPQLDFDESIALSYPYQKNKDYIHISTKNVEVLIAELINKNIPLKNMQLRKKNLEDLFIELTGKTLRQ